MKKILNIFLVFLITQGYGYTMDYFNTPVCGKFKNYYKIFPDIETLMIDREFTGRDWWLVEFTECQNPYSACPLSYQRICAYSNTLNEFKTFANECYLNVEKSKTGIGWIKTFNFECPTFSQAYLSYESSTSVYKNTATTIPPIQTYTPVPINVTTQEAITTDKATTTSEGNTIITSEPMSTTEQPIITETTTTPNETEETITTEEPSTEEYTDAITVTEETNTTSEEYTDVITVTEETNTTSPVSPITEIPITSESPTTISSYPSGAIIPGVSTPSIRTSQYNVHSAPYAERDYYHQPIYNYYNYGPPPLSTCQPQPNPFYSISHPQSGFYGSLPYGPFTFGIPVTPVTYFAMVPPWLNHFQGV